MLKKVFSFLLTGAIFSMTILPVQTSAQNLTNRTAENKTSASFDLRQTLAGVNADNSTVRLNVKKIEKDYYNSTKQKFSGGQKTALYVGIGAAIVAVVIILIAVKKDDAKIDNGVAYAGCPGNPLCQ